MYVMGEPGHPATKALAISHRRRAAADAPGHLGTTNVRDNVHVVSVTSNLPAVGRRVRLLREGMNLSLRDLAERSGVSAQMLSQVERGETSPTIATAERIAAGLDLTLSQLLRLDEGDGGSVAKVAERRAGGVAAYGHRFEVRPPPLPGQRVEVSEHFLAPG